MHYDVGISRLQFLMTNHSVSLSMPFLSESFCFTVDAIFVNNV